MWLNLSKHGKMERLKMTFLSRDKRKRVGATKELLINILYGIGVKGQKISKIVGVSRATVYRHIYK